MNKKNKTSMSVRILAGVLALLMLGGTVAGVLMFFL